MPTNTETSILGLSKALFWDVDPQTIDIQKHAAYIIERVVSRGTWEEFKIILEFYRKPKVKRVVKKLRYMNDRDIHFCSVYFNVPIVEFRSYKMKQLKISCWDL